MLTSAIAQLVEPRDWTVELSAQVTSSQAVISWPPDSGASSYKISRKILGTTSWSQIAELPGNATTFADNITSGSAYEYEVEERSSFGGSIYGYIYAGNAVSLPATRGKVLLVVDRTYAADLAFELGQLEQDLIGDGWSVVRFDVGRNDPPGSVRGRIQNEYNADPANVKTVFLFGHVPVPYSGDLNPDMHPGHRGAWPADVYYGDVDGNWTDNSASNTTAEDPRNFNTPGDGKFDQSAIPSKVELEVGRVDLSDMPSFLPLSEKDLLRRYLQKDHAYRHKQFTAAPRALVHDNFGEIDRDVPVTDAWRNFAPFFGVQNIRSIGPNQYFEVLSGDSYLWSYGAGGGSYDKADGVGSTLDFARRDPKTVFTILHGSYFGDWDFTDNFTRAPLGTASYGLACIWAGLPHWFLHPMALGESLGYVTKLNQNNSTGLYKTPVNLSAGQVHIALMGDPTLRMHVVGPPMNLAGQVGAGIVLNWIPSSDAVLGYSIYRADNPRGPFTRLNRSYVSGTSYTDTTAAVGAQTYMVRAIKTETSASGTYINASQGAFVTINVNGTPNLNTVTIIASDSEAREADGDSAAFTIRRTGSAVGALTVNFSIGGSAQNGTDYQTISSSVLIPAGQSEINVSIRPGQDSREEGTESVVISLAPSTLYQIGNPSTAQILIIDQPVNHPPTISTIGEQTIPEDGTAGPISFTIGDQESSPVNLTVTASSSNAAVVRSQDITLGGSGPSRTITVRPVAQASGSSTITLQVRDGQLVGTSTFRVNVNAVDDPPTITAISDVTVNQDQISNDLPFSVADQETTAANLTLVAASSNPALLPLSGILFGGGGAEKIVRLVPLRGQSGTADVTVTVSDGTFSASRQFRLTVVPINNPPPRFAAVSIAANGVLELRFEGLPGRAWSIDSSSDLRTWAELGGGTVTDNSTVVFRDSGSPNQQRRYYRLVWR